MSDQRPGRAERLEHAEGAFREGNYDEAAQLYESIHRSDPEWVYAEHALMMVGVCHDRRGNRKLAIRTWEHTVAEYPNIPGFSAVTWYYLAEAYAANGESDRAAHGALKCLELVHDREAAEFPASDARMLLDGLARGRER